MKMRPVLIAALIGPLAPLAVLRAGQQSRADNPHQDDRLDCAQCHNAERWTPVVAPPGFHHQATGFALEGVHARVSCRNCHRTLVFQKVGTACADCHGDAHRGELGFRCEVCHTPRSWQTQRTLFDVHGRTRFPLAGMHARVDCDACHRGRPASQYATTPTDCASCHVQSYSNARNPSHTGGGFSKSCEGCHTVYGWRPATGIDHNKTRFPLVGAHQLVDCARCHTGGRFAGTPIDCWSCHQANYDRTTNPNHVASGFPRTCDSCHSATAWRPASAIDHSKTRFPLTGAHQGVDCTRCHAGNQFAGTPTDCWSCHQPAYNATTNPSHVASGFPRTCESCHTTAAWKPASFDHGKTRFPLTGAHKSVDCARCHAGGRYTGTPTDCYSCHQDKYSAARNPDHSGFPRTCEACHSTNAWTPARFDHNATRFPLTGAHRSVDCSRCHGNGRYAGTPTDCYSCHQGDYNKTSNPNHAAAGFPTRCLDCHTTNGWRPASFDHDGSFFPINSGRHRGVWSSCSDCHTNPGNYRVFECVNCHAHAKSEMDGKHRGVGGYSYSSPACYRCHPRGVGGG